MSNSWRYLILMVGALSTLTSTVHGGETLPKRHAPILLDHTMQSGETLWSLALHYGISVKEIRDANRLSRDREPTVGSKLSIPIDPLTNPLAARTGSLNVASRGVPDLIRSQAARTGSPPDKGGSGEDAEATEETPVEVDLERGADGFVLPVRGSIMSRYGMRRRRLHTGIDIKAARGTPIHAAMAGRVIFSGTVRGHGRVIVLEHEDGFATVYSHNQKNLVRGDPETGERVEAGQVIATVGASGNATTPHVHFEIRRFEEPINPLPFIQGRRTLFETASGREGRRPAARERDEI